MTIKQQFGGEWTTQKLDRLRQYLSAYTTILSKQKGLSFAYIDAFAGTGYRELKETEKSANLLFPELAEDESQRFLQASTRIALDCKPEFHKYIFIEKYPEKIAELKASLLKDFCEKEDRLTFKDGDANLIIRTLCNKKWERHRAVMFLDPFGMQVSWSTIEAVAKTKAIDLWTLFPLGVAVNRMLTKTGQIRTSWKHRLDEIFGSNDWSNAFYRTITESTLFGEQEHTHTKDGEFPGDHGLLFE